MHTDRYQGKYFSVLGDSISTLAGWNPPDHAVFYNWEHKRPSGVLGPEDTWWGKVIDALGGQLLMNESWSGSLVCKHPRCEIESYGCSDVRTGNLGKDGLAPDVVMVLLGINDWGNGMQVTPRAGEAELSVFSVAYETMLGKIRRNYPNAEIWCMTFPRSYWSKNENFMVPSCYAGVHIEEYCHAIRRCARKMGCRLVEIDDPEKRYDTIDGFHPTAEGMQTIADAVLRGIENEHRSRIVDSHAHYCHNVYAGEFTYLDYGSEGFYLSRGDRWDLVGAMERAGIELCIEPSIGLERIEAQLALVEAHGPYFRLALGVHPKECVRTPWKDRKKLRQYVKDDRIVAIGEAGLDYHLPQKEQKRLYQKMWFAYQIRLAHERGLPMVLHLREADQDILKLQDRQADRDALKLLRRYRHLLHGGVNHCFGGDYETAMAYIDLGFALGIGGRLLRNDTLGLTLQDTVRRVPLTALLLETDAPYILPDLRDLSCTGKQRKKVRNSSLILPAVLDKIAELREESREAVEETIYRNTLRVFRLEENEPGR